MEECSYNVNKKKKVGILSNNNLTTFDGKKRNGNHYMHMYDKKNYNSGSVLLILNKLTN